MMVKLWLIFFLFFTISYGKPLKDKSKKVSTKAPAKASKVVSDMDALKYLDKYGYNHCHDHGNGETMGKDSSCPSSFETMIEQFQTIYRLPTTGKLDNATTTLMNRPRCNLGDHPLNCYASRPWPNATLKWKLTNEIPKFGKDKIRLHLQEAFNDWARYAPLEFREAAGSEKADFSISFQAGDHGDGLPFDGAGGILTHAFFPRDGRIHFDATEEWTDKYDGSGYNFRLVATHAIGHALGLAHSQDSKALMYPFYQLFQPKDLLPKEDRDSIRVLYGTSVTNKPTIRKIQTLSQDRCAHYPDVVFGGGSDKLLYTLDHDLVWRYHLDLGQWDKKGSPITEIFPGAEPHMMAGILSPITQKIYLFKDYRVWRFSSSKTLDSGFPKRVNGTGTPFNPIAALYERKYIWLLKGGLVFKFDEKYLRYESDKRPKRIDEQFPGVPKNVGSGFTHDGKHYFFTESDRNVYVFDTKTKRLGPGYPKPMTTGWFACKGN